MNERIDLLAVLDREIAYQAANGFLPGHLNDVRAAVAELIEAAKIVEVCYRNRRLSAAIARCCGGGK